MARTGEHARLLVDLRQREPKQVVGQIAHICRGLCGGGCVELGEGALALVATGDGVVASRVDGAGDTAAALDEALDAAAAARGRMRAALVERLSSG